MPRAKILDATDNGTIWTLEYLMDNPRNRYGTVNFDWRMFADFYEGATGRNYYRDYDFGRGARAMSRRLCGRHISVDGDIFNEAVRLED